MEGMFVNDACKIIHLGAMDRHMYASGITNLSNEAPYIGYSIEWIQKTIVGFFTPQVHSSSKHSCGVTDELQCLCIDIIQSTKDAHMEDVVLPIDRVSTSKTEEMLRKIPD
jgi:predicted AlkP superfamily phosphohydrolase/phosphomutase